MKKFVLLLFIFCLSPIQVFGAEFKNYCSDKTLHKVSSGVPKFFSNVTGMNFLTTKILEAQIQKSLKREFQGNFNVEVYPFGTKDLMNGKFKKITIDSPKVVNKGFVVSDVHSETECDYNHVKYENGQFYFVENMVISYNAKVTQDNLQETISSNTYLNAFSKIKVSSMGEVMFHIMKPVVEIKKDKLVMKYDVLAPHVFGSKPFSLKFSTELEVRDGKILFRKINFGSPLANVTLKSFMPLVNMLNPFTYNLNLDDKYNAIVKVRTIKMLDGEIIINGIVVIPKSYYNN